MKLQRFNEYSVNEEYNLNTIKNGVDAGVPVKVKLKNGEICEVIDVDIRDIHDGTLTVKDKKGYVHEIEHDDIDQTIVENYDPLAQDEKTYKKSGINERKLIKDKVNSVFMDDDIRKFVFKHVSKFTFDVEDFVNSYPDLSDEEQQRLKYKLHLITGEEIVKGYMGHIYKDIKAHYSGGWKSLTTTFYK